MMYQTVKGKSFEISLGEREGKQTIVLMPYDCEGTMRFEYYTEDFMDTVEGYGLCLHTEYPEYDLEGRDMDTLCYYIELRQEDDDSYDDYDEVEEYIEAREAA